MPSASVICVYVWVRAPTPPLLRSAAADMTHVVDERGRACRKKDWLAHERKLLAECLFRAVALAKREPPAEPALAMATIDTTVVVTTPRKTLTCRSWLTAATKSPAPPLARLSSDSMPAAAWMALRRRLSCTTGV